MLNENANHTYVNMSPFRFWCQKVLPLVYDDSLSYYEILCKVVEYINGLIENDKAIVEEIENTNSRIDDTNASLNLTKADVAELQTLVAGLQEELRRIENGEAEGMYINALRNYIDNNLEGIVGRIVKFISFGLSADGYFTALIPETWQFIHFDTIFDPENGVYGNLVLNW